MSERCKRSQQSSFKSVQWEALPHNFADGSLRKTLSEGEDLHTSALKTRLRSRGSCLDFATARPWFRLLPLAINETVLPQIKEGVVLPRSKEELRMKLLRCLKLVRLLALIELQLKSYARYDGYSELLKEISHRSSGQEFTVNQFTMAFDKASFFAHNTNYVPHWAINMLSKPSAERSSSEIHHLALLLRTMKFFGDDFAWEHLLELCRHCEYSKYEKERVILKIGHIPYYCYLLFSGSVHVSIAKDTNADGVKVPSYTKSILRRGAIFGDVAVIYNVRRTATVICREDVECLLVDEETCRKIFPEEKDNENKIKMQYLKDSGLLDGWPHSAISKMTIHSNIFRTYYGEVLEVNSALSEFIYIVTKGRVDVILRVDMDSLQRSPATLVSKFPVVGGAQRELFVCVDHLIPYQSCDLSSLLDDVSPPRPLTLVSRGAVILKVPKIRLHTTAPHNCWKTLLLKAATVPRYPASEALCTLIANELHWYAYRHDVLSDLLGKDPKKAVAMTLLPPVTTPLKLLPSLENKVQK